MAATAVRFPGQTIAAYTAVSIVGTSGTVASASFYFPKPGLWRFSLWDYYTSDATLDIDLEYQIAFEDVAASYITAPALVGYSGDGDLRTAYAVKSTWDGFHNYPIAATYLRFLITKNAGNNGTVATVTMPVYFTKLTGFPVQ